MNKLNMHTQNQVDINIRRIGELFPNALTERKNEKGEVEQAIDFDVLRQELSQVLVEGPQERYQFTWPDKRKAQLLANAPISDTLRPCREESVDFDSTENLYIEGDNLNVLKLLQETYLGKVKMIYVDPPYNTGNDSFVYDDEFDMDSSEFASASKQFEDGKMMFDIRQNNESNGRYHTDWLNMMYPRLRLAKDLLSDDGVIFISIDDNEQSNLKRMCDEVLGPTNFLAMFCWKTDGNFDNQAKIKNCHEYIMLYAKHVESFPAPPVVDPNVPASSKLYRSEVRNTIIKNGPKNPISAVVIPKGFPSDFESGFIKKKQQTWPRYTDDVIVQSWKTQDEVAAESGWASKAQLEEFIRNGFNPVIDSKGQSTRFVITRTGAIEAIKKRQEDQSHVVSVLMNMGGAQKASLALGELSPFFSFPKPLELIKYFLKMNCGADFYVLDFFSGSATTAHAVMQLNAEDGGKRKFIMVQLPEETDEKSESYKAGYKNICEIGKERIRRAGAKIKNELQLHNQQLKLGEEPRELPDMGFRVLKLASSNMKDVYYAPQDYTQARIDDLIDNIKEGRTPQDLLFQVMLELGVLLSSPVSESKVNGQKVFSVADGFLMACFDSNIKEDTITHIAKQRPHYAVFRDSGYATDSVAVNFEQIFKAYSPDTVRRVL